jgi:hypothetical protein
MVELAVRQANGNKTHAGCLLDISRDALRYKLKKFDLLPALKRRLTRLPPKVNLAASGLSSCGGSISARALALVHQFIHPANR